MHILMAQEFDAVAWKLFERTHAQRVFQRFYNVGTGDPHSGALERAVKLGQNA